MHITPVLQSHHWLLLSYLVQFEVLTIMYKALRILGYLYLQNYLPPVFCHDCAPHLFRAFCQRPGSTTARTRAFSVVAPIF